MSNITTVHKSRFGFHPCNYKTFLKLKRLHKLYWQTVYDFHRWHRWWRKQIHNRRGQEPLYCPIFVDDQVWYKSVRIHGENGFKLYPKTVIDLQVIDRYQAARKPKDNPIPPWDAQTVAQVDLLYNRARPYIDTSETPTTK